jgi:hypothetical protein
MTKKLIMIGVIFCSIIFISLPAIPAQWSVCTIDKIGVSALSGNYYVNLSHVSGGTSWTGSRSFILYPNEEKILMAICLTAQSQNGKLSVWLASTEVNSFVYSAYTVAD